MNTHSVKGLKSVSIVAFFLLLMGCCFFSAKTIAAPNNINPTQLAFLYYGGWYGQPSYINYGYPGYYNSGYYPSRYYYHTGWGGGYCHRSCWVSHYNGLTHCRRSCY